ncbi:tail fiber assembly protein [Kluyvera cryocrescens]|uniref:tail fiber assembly protein n=1 Tax=Kluyvera cryocrescens TaxID=580 RepID=UPI002B1686D9|nr:tail fiber assembly protein [Kluyvera cryocrescens]
MSFKMSATVQLIKVFNLRADTKEFIGTSDAYIQPFTGLPANSTDIEPPACPADSVAIFDLNKKEWSIQENHRGQTVYDTETGQPVYISKPGALPENTTTIPYPGEFYVWNGKAWKLDEKASHAAAVASAEAQKEFLINAAQESISVLQTKLLMGRQLTDEEKDKVNKTLDYIDEVTAVITDSAPDIEWPEIK